MMCRVPELVALLDPDRSFPAASFASDAVLLGALQQLGMRSALSVQALLDSAQYIERLGQTDHAEATERCGTSTQVLSSALSSGPQQASAATLSQVEWHSICLPAASGSPESLVCQREAVQDQAHSLICSCW